jgi:hypothetical protein
MRRDERLDLRVGSPWDSGDMTGDTTMGFQFLLIIEFPANRQELVLEPQLNESKYESHYKIWIFLWNNRSIWAKAGRKSSELRIL